MLYKKAENETHVLEIVYDESPESPREWDNLGTMTCWSRHYNLGDEHSYSSNRDFLEALAGNYIEDEDEIYNMDDSELCETIRNHVVLMPVFMYEHGGVALNTVGYSCSWDSGQVGWIYVTNEDVLNEGQTVEGAMELLKDEVNTYSDYVNGNAFGFILEKKRPYRNSYDEVKYDLETIDSCFGFIGTDDLEEQIKEYIPTEHRSLLDSLEYA